MDKLGGKGAFYGYWDSVSKKFQTRSETVYTVPKLSATGRKNQSHLFPHKNVKSKNYEIIDLSKPQKNRFYILREIAKESNKNDFIKQIENLPSDIRVKFLIKDPIEPKEIFEDNLTDAEKNTVLRFKESIPKYQVSLKSSRDSYLYDQGYMDRLFNIDLKVIRKYLDKEWGLIRENEGSKKMEVYLNNLPTEIEKKIMYLLFLSLAINNNGEPIIDEVKWSKYNGELGYLSEYGEKKMKRIRWSTHPLSRLFLYKLSGIWSDSYPFKYLCRQAASVGLTADEILLMMKEWAEFQGEGETRTGDLKLYTDKTINPKGYCFEWMTNKTDRCNIGQIRIPFFNRQFVSDCMSVEWNAEGAIEPVVQDIETIEQPLYD